MNVILMNNEYDSGEWMNKIVWVNEYDSVDEFDRWWQMVNWLSTVAKYPDTILS